MEYSYPRGTCEKWKQWCLCQFSAQLQPSHNCQFFERAHWTSDPHTIVKVVDRKIIEITQTKKLQKSMSTRRAARYPTKPTRRTKRRRQKSKNQNPKQLALGSLSVRGKRRKFTSPPPRLIPRSQIVVSPSGGLGSIKVPCRRALHQGVERSPAMPADPDQGSSPTTTNAKSGD